MSSPSLAVEVEVVLMVSMARHQTYMLYAVHANDVLLLFTLHVHARNVYENKLL